MVTSEERSEILDTEHLKLLSWAYYVLGIVNALFLFVPFIYICMGLMFMGLSGTMPHKAGEPPPEMFGAFFVILGSIVGMIIVVFAALKIYAGYCLSQRRNRIFVFVAAAVLILNIPIGTFVAVLTFIVLSRKSVIRKFEASLR